CGGRSGHCQARQKAVPTASPAGGRTEDRAATAGGAEDRHHAHLVLTTAPASADGDSDSSGLRGRHSGAVVVTRLAGIIRIGTPSPPDGRKQQVHHPPGG